MSENIKLTFRQTAFLIYDDKSHYPSTFNVFRKKQSYKYQLNLMRRFKKRSDLSLYDHKFDLIYCQWNTRKHGAVCNVSFLMVSL